MAEMTPKKILENIGYREDIHSKKPFADLWKTPPSKLVVPISSSFR